MNAKIGKPWGLALLMTVGLLAAIFALGAFNPYQAGAHPDHPSSFVAPHSVTLVASEYEGSETTTPIILTVQFKTSSATPENIKVLVEGFTAADGLANTNENVALIVSSGRADDPDTTDDESLNITIPSSRFTFTIGSDTGIVGAYTVFTLSGIDIDEDVTGNQPIPSGRTVTISFPAPFVIGSPVDTADPMYPRARSIRASVGRASVVGEHSSWKGWGVETKVLPAIPGTKTHVTVKVVSGRGLVDSINTAGRPTVEVGRALSFDMGSFGVPSSNRCG